MPGSTTNKQIDRQAGRQAGRQADRQTDRQTDRQDNNITYCFSNKCGEVGSNVLHLGGKIRT